MVLNDNYELVPDESTTTFTLSAGYYCSDPSLKTKCSGGFLCPPRSTTPTPCIAGWLCDGSDSASICPVDHYCPIGAKASIPCDLGNYFLMIY